MHEAQLVEGRVPPVAAADVGSERAALEDRLHVPDAHRVLRVELGLVEKRRGRLLEEAAPRVVAQRVVVPEEVHHADPVSGAALGPNTARCAGGERRETESGREQVGGGVAGGLREHTAERGADDVRRRPGDVEQCERS